MPTNIHNNIGVRDLLVAEQAKLQALHNHGRLIDAIEPTLSAVESVLAAMQVQEDRIRNIERHLRTANP